MSGDMYNTLGRLVKIVTRMTSAPSTLAADVDTNPLQKLPYWISEASKVKEHKLYERLQELLNALDGLDLPTTMTAEQRGQYWTGFYKEYSHGGARKGSGRPTGNNKHPVMVYVTSENKAWLDDQPNKTKAINDLIEEKRGGQ